MAARKSPSSSVKTARKRGTAAPPPKARNARIPTEQQDAIVAFIREHPGVSRNAVAREFGVSPSTVTKYAKAVGADEAFDRSRTETATRARQADLADRAVSLADRLIEKAHGLLDTWDSPYLVYNFGGRDNDYNEHTLDAPPMEVRAKIVTVAAIAIDKALKIKKETTSGSTPASAFEAFMRMIGGDDPGDMSVGHDVESGEAVE